MSEDLSKLRDAIDAIDADILQALSRRMQLSDRVIAAKGDRSLSPWARSTVGAQACRSKRWP